MGRILKETTRTPTKQHPHARLLLVPGSTHVQVISLAERTRVYATHYDPVTKRHSWCPEDAAACERCALGYSARNSYYLPVLTLPSKQPRLLAIPERAYLHCRALRDLEGALRGRGLELWRIHGGVRGPVAIRVLKTVWEDCSLPQGWDIEPQLSHIWGLQSDV
jgi:hypothetical protein